MKRIALFALSALMATSALQVSALQIAGTNINPTFRHLSYLASGAIMHKLLERGGYVQGHPTKAFVGAIAMGMVFGNFVVTALEGAQEVTTKLAEKQVQDAALVDEDNGIALI
jgi:hypothetical protein